MPELRSSLLAIGLVAALTVSCDDFSGVQDHSKDPLRSERTAAAFQADFEAEGVRLQNETAETAYYLVYNPDFLAQYARCLGPACPHLEPGATTVVSFHLIPGSGEPSFNEVVVEYWRLVQDGQNGWRAENVRTVRASR